MRPSRPRNRKQGETFRPERNTDEDISLSLELYNFVLSVLGRSTFFPPTVGVSPGVTKCGKEENKDQRTRNASFNSAEPAVLVSCSVPSVKGISYKGEQLEEDNIVPDDTSKGRTGHIFAPVLGLV